MNYVGGGDDGLEGVLSLISVLLYTLEDGGGGLHADEDILRGDKGVGLKRLYIISGERRVILKECDSKSQAGGL